MNEAKVDQLLAQYRRNGIDAFFKMCRAKKKSYASVSNANKEYFALGYATAMIELKQRELIVSPWRKLRVRVSKWITQFFTGRK